MTTILILNAASSLAAAIAVGGRAVWRRRRQMREQPQYVYLGRTGR